jgi:DNA-directed RNA polymerase subunit beta
LEVRDTKLGNEELQMIYQTFLKNENGMIRIGAEVKPGDILIGKLLKRRIRSYSGEKLLRAIFGDKAGDVKCFIKSVSFFTWCCFGQKIVRKSSKR